ncbi:hypothetical protein [Bosea sp. 124]|uniref:hypothetical protein n=1 Tax=Bosea sp. 124 TaxID=2135642 RepID=UPI000D4FA37E|nr:hypothetical protein [Bosea sp. 124]PTM43613.1 hypothetical protein C8D03_5235 [Bosea sp. 124]
MQRGMIDGVELPFDEGPDVSLTFVHDNAWWTRLIVGGAGLMTFIAPYELLWRQKNPFAIAMLPFWLISLGALSIGLPALAFALAGPRGRITFDPTVRAIRIEAGLFADWAWGRLRRFEDVLSVEVRRDDEPDDGPCFDLRLTWRDGRRPLPLWRFRSEHRASHVADRVRALLAGANRPG